MKPSRRALLFVVAVAALPTRARAEPKERAEPKQHSTALTRVELKVVDATQDRAYLEPGEQGGLRVGDEVSLGNRSYRVVAVSRAFSAIATQGRRARIGSAGHADLPLPRPDAERSNTRERPQPLARFRSEWASPEPPPAAKQRPERIPLGGASTQRNRLVLSNSFYGLVPTGKGEPTLLANELRSRLHYAALDESWAWDADLALQSFAGDSLDQRPGAAARRLLRVRELTLTAGRSTGFRSVFGRLRAASSVAGALDGARLETPLLPGLRLQAFGGTLPNTWDGLPSTRVTRFGAELVYQALESPARPSLILGGQASRFDGALDERKAYASFELLPANSRLGGQVEVSFFDAANPWRAPSVEWTSGALDGSVNIGPFRVGGRIEFRRPERSRWLASLLPTEWLCWGDPSLPTSDCNIDNGVVSWMLDAGVRLGRLAVDLGGQSTYARGTDSTNYGGFSNLRWLGERFRFDAGASAYHGSVLRSVALTFAPGIRLMRGDADLSLRYRPASVRYRADTVSRLEHAVGGGLWLAARENLEFDIQSDWIRGGTSNALLLQAVATWRLAL